MSSAEPTPAHQPYVPDEQHLPEFTWPAVLVGAVLGIVFGASSLYLVLKVGLTVSASIPVAVLSITLFRLFARVLPIRRATILENNIVQTTGSAGESIAFGVGVTMPALMMLGFEMSIGRVMVVSILGGLLGILMMIPLRRAFIVKKHGILKYPEATACADVLIVGEQGRSRAEAVVHRQYILYSGAGAVAAGGIISLFQALPLIIGSVGAAYRDLRGGSRAGAAGARRTDRDLPLWIVGAGTLALVAAIWATTP